MYDNFLPSLSEKTENFQLFLILPPKVWIFFLSISGLSATQLTQHDAEHKFFHVRHCSSIPKWKDREINVLHLFENCQCSSCLFRISALLSWLSIILSMNSVMHDTVLPSLSEKTENFKLFLIFPPKVWKSTTFFCESEKILAFVKKFVKKLALSSVTQEKAKCKHVSRTIKSSHGKSPCRFGLFRSVWCCPDRSSGLSRTRLCLCARPRWPSSRPTKKNGLG